MTFYVDIVTSPGIAARAFNYNATTKSLTAVDNRVSFETGTGYWAIKIKTDYAMLFDVDGLLIGDLAMGSLADYPRLEFFAAQCGGIKQRMASLSQTGKLTVNRVIEEDLLPAVGLNILDNAVITPGGVIATTKINEVWFLVDGDGNYVVSNGQLIRVRI